MRHIIWLLLIYCLMCQETEATSVIAVRTSSSIYIAADSKLVTGDHSMTGIGCKIGVANDVFWGEAGIIQAANGFDVNSIARSAMSATGPVDARISSFESNAALDLGKIMDAIRGENLPYFTQRIGKPALQMVFAYFDSDIPYLDSISFITRIGPASDIIIDVIESIFPNKGPQSSEYVTLGYHETIDREIGKFPNIWRDLGIPLAVRHLIQTEINAVPNDVGSPIAIVGIDEAGSHWISKGACGP
jgi:hypothetical protein